MSTIEEIIALERLNSEIDVEAMGNFIYSPSEADVMRNLGRYDLKTHDLNKYNLNRIDLIKDSLDDHIHHVQSKGIRNNLDVLAYLMRISKQEPLNLHASMFIRCIEMLGTPRQHQTWLAQAKNYQIFGCYAQTELGHGSDVQNLETTATYDMEYDAFIINTPDISAAKCWIGDLGLFATHALVFAQMIVQGKNYGVQSFIVPVRDPATFKPLPGIEVGDVGPKIGFHSKDNGYLLMKNISVPKTNMLRRFTSVSKTGDIKKKGNPKIGYAAMMIIRQVISIFVPRAYGQAITIALRYSLFRTQFLNSSKTQIPIINYQTQKDKIISRIAEYVSITIGGIAIREISDRNLVLVKTNADFSIMAEAHTCLCMGKALFSEIVYDGMEICRKSCGGHGFSNYSGLPSLLYDNSSNLTYEGENTILYLQVARYLLKNYKYSVTKPEKVGESAQYLLKYNDFLENRVNADRNNWKNWNIEDIGMLLSQATCYNLSLVTEMMLNKAEGVSNLDVWNKVAGSEIKKTAFYHSLLYVFNNFRKALDKDTSVYNKAVSTNLCLLFGTNAILKYSGPIIEGGFITSEQLESLANFKEVLLESLRPHIARIVDAFLLPKGLIQSALTQGDPYENYLELARKNEINNKVQESAIIVRNNMVQAMAIHQSKL